PLTHDERMPGCDNVDLVTARCDRLRNRLHERADAVPRETRVRRRYHHDDVRHGHRREPRSARRHGITMDSRMTLEESLDCPCRRSTKMIGTAAIRAPLRAASKSISTRNA